MLILFFDLTSCTKPLRLPLLLWSDWKRSDWVEWQCSIIPARVFSALWVGKDEKQIKLFTYWTHTSGLPALCTSVVFLESAMGYHFRRCWRCILIHADGNLNREVIWSTVVWITLPYNILLKLLVGRACVFFVKKIYLMCWIWHIQTSIQRGDRIRLRPKPRSRKNGLVLVCMIHWLVLWMEEYRVMRDCFRNANDLGILVAALMNGGEINGKKNSESFDCGAYDYFARVIEEVWPYAGWDMSSAYSGCKGDGSFQALIVILATPEHRIVIDRRMM